MKVEEVLSSLGYDVLSQIGEGGFGKVKLAKSKMHPDKVAIKIMDRRDMPPDFVEENLPQELAIIKLVKHQHIIQVHQIHDMPSGLIFIVMEAAEMNLAQKVEEVGPIPTHLARLWFSQIMRAMVYLHDKDIAHRDLKCDNVLLTADGQVRLTDFGFGCFHEGLSKLRTTLCGTPEYTAPEMLRWRPYDPKKSDVWSLGVILYVMITGCLPFRTDKTSVLKRLQREALKFPKNVSVEELCRELISSMLCYNPTSRPSVAQAEGHPWLKITEEQEMTEAADLPVAEKALEEKEPETLETQPLLEVYDEQPQEQPQRKMTEAATEAGRAFEEKELETLENPPLEEIEDGEQELQLHHSVEEDVQEVELEWKGLSMSSGLLSCIMKTLEQENNIQGLENTSRAIDGIPDTEDDLQQIEEEPQSSSLRNHVEPCSLHRNRCQPVDPELVESSSGAGVEVVDVDELGCFGCGFGFCTAVKRAAKFFVAKPIVRASQALRKSVRKIFGKKSSVPNSSLDSQQGVHHPEGPTKAPAGENATQGFLDQFGQPPVAQAKRGRRFPHFKILSKKKNKLHPIIVKGLQDFN